jgi:uncharacterized protein (DUF2062 family)
MVKFSRVRVWLEQLLHTHDTPQRTAAAYALGVFLGFSPLLGFHTILGLILAFALNLNRVAVLLGVYSNLPWILVPYYSLATWLGASLLRTAVPPGAVEALLVSMKNLSWTEFRSAAGAPRARRLPRRVRDDHDASEATASLATSGNVSTCPNLYC